LAAHQNPSATKEKTTDISAPATSSTRMDDVAQAGDDRENGSRSIAIQTEDGLVQEVTCTASSITNLRFAILGKTLFLAAADSSKITLMIAGKGSTLSVIPCEQWKGRKAKIAFTPSPVEKRPAEIMSIDFL
jgi:hypothetical protein